MELLASASLRAGSRRARSCAVARRSSRSPRRPRSRSCSTSASPRAPARTARSPSCGRSPTRGGVLCSHGDVITELLRSPRTSGRRPRRRAPLREGLRLGARARRRRRRLRSLPPAGSRMTTRHRPLGELTRAAAAAEPERDDEERRRSARARPAVRCAARRVVRPTTSSSSSPDSCTTSAPSSIRARWTRTPDAEAPLVAPLLGARVGRLVGRHADAKRYLVTTDPAYRSHLSARSVETLREQGGVMTEREVTAFAAIDDLDAVLALRRADDDAKVPGRDVPGLDTWLPLLERRRRGRRSG